MKIKINNNLEIDDSDITWRFSTSGGPGGQHANRTKSRVELVLDLEAARDIPDQIRNQLIGKLGSTVRFEVDESRSQAMNKNLATEKLITTLNDALIIPKKRRKTKPTRSSKKRRLKAKRKRGETKANRRNVTRDDY